MQGKIVKGIAGFYYVHVVESGVYECKAKGIFRKDGVKPLVGDNVEIEVLDEEEKKGNIREILTRKNELIRPAVANIDQALVVFAVTKPKPHFNLLDRFLVMMEQKKIPVILCFNKSDIAKESDISKMEEIYRSCGYPVFFTSAKEGWKIEEVKKILEDAGVGFVKLGKPTDERHILVSKGDATYQFGVDYMRDVWYSSSYLLDRKQSMNGCAKKRFENYKMQPVEFAFMPEFKGKLSQYGITPDRRTPSGVRAAIIREKGTNGEREMAYSLYLAGFDVKDVTMTDLISGRETLEDVNMIVYCGGFSNSDVLGSAKGWAGGFLFNPKAKEALDKFYAREDTLSLGICNGCQLMMELGLVNPEHEKKGKMLHNESHKFESTFVGVTIPTNRSVMFGSLSGSKLGIWVAHGEGKFSLPYDEDQYNVVAKYSYDEYPGNPNGSDYSIAALASADGRHLAMMPHLERAIFPWQNACYPADRVHNDQVTPWIEAFVNARKWVEEKKK